MQYQKLLNIRETSPANLFPTFLLLAVELLEIVVKGALTFVNTLSRREGNTVSADADIAHRYLVYFSLPCVHWVRNWTSLSHCWEGTETFSHLLFCASQRRDCVDWSQTPGLNSSERFTTQNSPAKIKVEVSVSKSTLTGATMWQWFHCSPDLQSFSFSTIFLYKLTQTPWLLYLVTFTREISLEKSPNIN